MIAPTAVLVIKVACGIHIRRVPVFLVSKGRKKLKTRDTVNILTVVSVGRSQKKTMKMMKMSVYAFDNMVN